MNSSLCDRCKQPTSSSRQLFNLRRVPMCDSCWNTTFTQAQRDRIVAALAAEERRTLLASAGVRGRRLDQARAINEFRDHQATHCPRCDAVLPPSPNRRPRLCPACAFSAPVRGQAGANPSPASKKARRKPRRSSVYAYQGGAPGLGKRA